jgi:ferredoxin
MACSSRLQRARRGHTEGGKAKTLPVKSLIGHAKQATPMSRPSWFVELLKLAFPGRFVAAKTTKVPVVERVVQKMLFEEDDLYYLPQDSALLIGESVGHFQEVVLPSQIVDHFIQQAEVHWVMEECICRSATHCDDYPIDLGCLFLGAAAQGINPKLGHRVSKQEALAHAHRARDAGLIHLIGRNKLDTVWLGVGPRTQLLTICNCCPCCCIWRMHPDLGPAIQDGLQRMPGVRILVTDLCQGCETCVENCFVSAIQIQDGQAVIGPGCLGCSRCVTICPEGAIEVQIHGEDFITETLERITSLVEL